MKNDNSKFKAIRKDLKLSQVELAKKLSVSQGTITDIERGRISVSKRVREKLKSVLKVEYSNDDLQSALDTKQPQTVKKWMFCPHCGELLQ